MFQDFSIAEKGAGSYWPLSILRWVMVLVFVSFGIQKFTPQSAEGIAVYISNSPFVRGWAYSATGAKPISSGRSNSPRPCCSRRERSSPSSQP